MENSAVKTNNVESRQGYFYRINESLRSIEVNGRKAPQNQLLVLAKIFSCCKNENSLCYFSYEKIREELGISFGTIREGLKWGEEANLIEKVDRDTHGCGYKFISKLPGKEYDVLPASLCKKKYRIDGVERKLRSSSRTVAAHVATRALYDNKNVQKILKDKTLSIEYKYDVVQKAVFEYTKISNGLLSKKLNLSKKTVNAAFAELCAAGILECPDEKKGKNRYAHSTYKIIDKSIYNYLFYQKPKKAKKITPEQARIAAVNAKADRERWYNERRQKAESRPNKIKEELKKDSEWRQTLAALSNLEFEFAKDNHYNNDRNKIALQEKQNMLLVKKEQILRKFGYTMDDLTPKYYCPKCNDSGYYPNGKGCDCYNKRE